MLTSRSFFYLVPVVVLSLGGYPATAQTSKTASVFFSAEHRAHAARSIAGYSWAADMQKKAISDAAPFLAMSDDELWSLMFGNTIKRSWMVWSNGHCPSCKGDVPMYTWKIDALKRPWKLQCPRCSELFPKNDF